MPKQRRPKYLKPADDCDEECPNNPDLLLLRDAAADERRAILEYLEAAQAGCLPELFLDVAADESRHFLEVMGHIIRLDPIQREAFDEVNLPIPLIRRPASAMKKQPYYMMNDGKLANQAESDQDIEFELPPENAMPLICRLTEALVGELAAANKYQRYMNEACDPKVKELFCRLMNDEKEHIAEFTAALFDVTGEPLPQELD